MWRERHVVEVGQVSDALPLTQATRLLEVGHDDVHRAQFHQLAEAVGEVVVFARADGRVGAFRDVAVGFGVLGGDGFFQKQQLERLEHLGHFLA